MKFLKVVVLVSALGLAACSSTPEKREIVGEVELLYNQGMDLLTEGRYGEAVNAFEELERQHPYSGWATRAQMMVVFAYYNSERYDEAVPAADRFIGSHPGHKDLPYILYLKAMSHYNRISDVRRDQQFTEEALQTFNELVQRYPESEYAKDAKLKITLCLDHLAGKEMMVGRYYLKNRRYMAAINRFRTVVENYQSTSQIQEALYRLSESYLALGIEDEATQSAAVLGHNYPSSMWYQKAYDLLGQNNLKVPTVVEETSWFGRVWKGLKNTVHDSNK
ncbi:MAG: outer membrane protein assembly factor BamD [Pseudomonadota bacterium]|nr:outer membrane protein assembly factor BamD [Pseudomonadota bacterium]MEC8467739.1 outer membrane protein assembly factor BamD [Pseudomonadota bacterium]